MMLLRTIKLHRSQEETVRMEVDKGRLKLALKITLKYPRSFIEMHEKWPKGKCGFEEGGLGGSSFFRKGVIFWGSVQ